MRKLLVWTSVLALGGCEKNATLPEGGKETISETVISAHIATEPDVPQEPAEPEVELDDEPAVDLLTNRHLLHQYNPSLVIPFASKGLWKYTQEYRRPFGETKTLDGRVGRVLSRSAATLRVPWRGDLDGMSLRVYLHGVSASQRLQVNVNGKRAGFVEVPREWSSVNIPIPDGLLKVGENEVLLTMRSQGNVGGSRTYGLLYSAELGVDEPRESADPPELAPEAALGVGSRWSFFTEIPHESYFVSNFEGPAPKVRIRTSKGEVNVEGQFTDDEVRVDLRPWAGQIVEFSLEAGTAWSNPRIALLKKEKKSRPAPTKNLILLVVDTLRSDRLELYGETRVKTPRMTDEGKNAVVFLNNQAASPSSPPSHASIQTGMIPRVHGVAGDKGRLKPETPLISSQLEAADVGTAYVGNNSFGMGRLREAGKWSKFVQPVSEGKGIDCTTVNSETFKFIDAQTEENQRFFVSMLPFEPHAPYRFHEGVTEKYHEGGWGPPVGKFADGYLLVDIMAGRKKMNPSSWSQLVALYDGEVEYMDRCFGDLVDGLKERQIWEETTIVMTSDHGEGFNERGRLGHAYGHYSELADVPFVIFSPSWVQGTGPHKISTPTSLLDIAPTVLDMMGVRASNKIQGGSVVPYYLRGGPWTPRVVSSEYGRSYGLRATDWRMIVNYDGSEELYDLRQDSAEKSNLIGEDTIAVRYLRDSGGIFLQYRSDWKTETWGAYNNHLPGFLEGSD